LNRKRSGGSDAHRFRPKPFPGNRNSLTSTTRQSTGQIGGRGCYRRRRQGPWQTYPAASWLLTHGFEFDTDLNQDLNGDGVTLLNAYALNLDPNNPLAGMPQPVLGPTTMSMTFYGAAQGVTYGAETSTDCQTWETAGVTISELDPANMRTVTVNRDSTRRFLRLTFGLSP
jgi:hypothetical protein